jgi:hypothetical protein
LVPAKFDLVVANFVPACVIDEVIERDFLVIGSPCMRQNGIRWSILACELDEAETLLTVNSQEPHRR